MRRPDDTFNSSYHPEEFKKKNQKANRLAIRWTVSSGSALGNQIAV
jgi:hypothetical protein